MSGYDVCKHGRIRCAECAYVEDLEDKIEGLEQQNKRYREALEEIARGRFPGASYIAKQALEVK